MNDEDHVLIVADQREICDSVQEYLSSEGYRVSTARNVEGMYR
jgi:DNA-binding NtrC family response regulator